MRVLISWHSYVSTGDHTPSNFLRLSSTNITWFILECFVLIKSNTSKVLQHLMPYDCQVYFLNMSRSYYDTGRETVVHECLNYFIMLQCIYLAIPRNYFHRIRKEIDLIPAAIYHLKVSNRNTRIRYEICSKLTI